MNYSDIIKSNNNINNLPIERMNFSINASPVKVEDVPVVINFSENPIAAIENYSMTCFSLLERIRLSKLSPRQILKRRLNEVVRYLRSNSPEKISENKEVVTLYLSEFVYQIILSLLNDPNVKQINLIMILGLSNILKNIKSVRSLQIILLRAKRELNQKGYLTKVIQDRLSESYSGFWKEFLVSIESRYLTSDKQGILSGVKSDGKE